MTTPDPREALETIAAMHDYRPRFPEVSGLCGYKDCGQGARGAAHDYRAVARAALAQAAPPPELTRFRPVHFDMEPDPEGAWVLHESVQAAPPSGLDAREAVVEAALRWEAAVNRREGGLGDPRLLTVEDALADAVQALRDSPTPDPVEGER